MNPMQKHPHFELNFIELFGCTLNMLAFISLYPINSLISSGTCSTLKISK